MKKIILGTTLFIALILVFGCKKDNTFKVVTDEVYTINETTKGGCFDYDPTDPTAIKPIVNITNATYIENGVGIVKYRTNYFCLANDSIDLKGNVLSFFLKPSDDNNTDCTCDYSWVIKLDIIENKGLKILYFEYENGNYVQKQEMENDFYIL